MAKIAMVGQIVNFIVAFSVSGERSAVYKSE
jgi:hypothetical protein